VYSVKSSISLLSRPKAKNISLSWIWIKMFRNKIWIPGWQT